MCAYKWVNHVSIVMDQGKKGKIEPNISSYSSLVGYVID